MEFLGKTLFEKLLEFEGEKIKKLEFNTSLGNKPIYIYINKNGNPFTKSTRHVEANVNTRKEN
jgi:hypothetical protein